MSDSDSSGSGLPKRPWHAVSSINAAETKGYIHIASANGEKVCDIFPFAGVGGIGAERALAVAEFTVNAANNGEP